jgi:hypothetical protein
MGEVTGAFTIIVYVYEKPVGVLPYQQTVLKDHHGGSYFDFRMVVVIQSSLAVRC